MMVFLIPRPGAAVFLLLLLQQLLMGTTLVTAQTTTATNYCYPTIGTLNAAMRTERLRIQQSGVAAAATHYEYILCPNTLFNTATEPLEPLLNHAVIRCGTTTTNGNTGRCVLSGGPVQVKVLDSLVPGYFIQSVSFVGLTFSGFGASDDQPSEQTMSIAAYASTTTTATFRDCVWENFDSDFVILQRAEKQGLVGPMTVEIVGGRIDGGTTGVILDNDGGLLRVNRLAVTDTAAAAVVATANNGASFLEDAEIQSSNVNSITYTTAGSTQSVLYTTVSRMNYMDDAFYVEGTGSSLLLEGVSLERNVEPTIPWNGVSVRTGAIARINESTISDNVSMEFGIVAFDSRGVWITDSFLNRNAGSEGETSISAPIFAITDAEVNMNRVELNENVDFSVSVNGLFLYHSALIPLLDQAMAVALIRSSLNIRWSCFQDSSSEFVVFVSNDGRFDVSGNFVSGVSSQRCETTGPRLFVEQTGSGCFLGSNQCEGTCIDLGNEESCQAQSVPTASPSDLATLEPTTATPATIPSTWPPLSPRPPVLQPIFSPGSTAPTTTEPSTASTVIETETPTPVPTEPVPLSKETTAPVLSPLIPTNFPQIGLLEPTSSPSGLVTPTIPSSARSRQPSGATIVMPSESPSTSAVPSTVLAPSMLPTVDTSPIPHDGILHPTVAPQKTSLQPSVTISPTSEQYHSKASDLPSAGRGKSETTSGMSKTSKQKSGGRRSMEGMFMMMSSTTITMKQNLAPLSSAKRSMLSGHSQSVTSSSDVAEGKGNGKGKSSSSKQRSAKGGKAVKRIMRAFRYTDGVNATAANATEVAGNTNTPSTRRRRG